ncbi:cytochrome c-type biogenesis protein [Varunaivibrio sulfuroxidans]|uniref:Cytochrome c-type biogenesis protein n=1 Tax=Varunaivibrio sulfuroxidans TaxID=1773489 RepID=A0A4R3JD77_9PROT|nr:cytochrome c-type biogenesis protein [Varunaivibrio sulfuroxidans]TCS63644.1 cytochrome c-type biogenesis protein CcmH [Varunaivibrio sulfuroxidans]WES30217.1 cytochrome c-type biogenesis protein CcmH [Varunaivibrio sulfuroxidans]
MRRFFLLLIGAAAVFGASRALAVEPSEMLANPVLEHRARVVDKQLRCVVCQNQSIDDSDADLAHDMRVLVRKRITAGDSNQQVIDYMVGRYGDFVLLDPPLKPATYVLWFGPAFIGLIGLGVLFLFYRRRIVRDSGDGDGDGEGKGMAEPPLSAAEKKQLESLLKGDNA